MYICPKCKSPELKTSLEYFECVKCNSKYNIVAGIPDFRVFSDKFYTSQEKEKVDALLEGSKTLKQCLEIYSEIDKYVKNNNQTALKLIEKNINVIIESLGKGVGIREYFDYYKVNEIEYTGKDILDVGCGFCNNTIQLSKYCRQIIAIDISLVNLIIASKILKEKNINNIHLACACSEYLPFLESKFDHVLSSGVIEHVEYQDKFISESHRVLKSQGSFIFGSPNRFYLGNEPHVNLPLVGFLPRSLMKIYVSLLSGWKLTYEGKRLLSYIELSKMLKKNYGNKWDCRTWLYIDTSKPANSILGKTYRKSVLFRKFIVLYDELILKMFCRAHLVRANKGE